MACCCIPCLPKTDMGGADDPLPIIEIDEVMKDFVWNDYLTHLNPMKRWWAKRQKSRYVVDVPAKYFRLEEYERSKVTPRGVDRGDSETALERNAGNDGGESKTQSLYTNYINDTPNEQSYKFRLEKSRKSTVGVTLQKGFTIGGRADFKLGLPPVAGSSHATGQIDMRFNVSKTATDVVEETVTFETTSDIKVEKKSKVIAKVTMMETEISYDFRVRTKLTLATGGAMTCVRRKRDNKPCHIYMMKKLDTVFKDVKNVEIKHQDVEKKGPDGKLEKIRDYFIVLETRGIVEGVRLSDQEIGLKSEPLVKVKEAEIPRNVNG